jgi:integrase
MPDQGTAIRINKKIEVATSDEDRIWKKLRKELRLEGGKGILFRDFCDVYTRLYVVSYNRCQRSKMSGLRILSEHFGSKPLEGITPQSIAEFCASRKAEGLNNKTINRNLSALSHALGWAVKKGYLEENPVSKTDRLKELDWIGERPDESVIDEVFAKLDPRVDPVFTFLRETGCRKNEAITLQASQLDFGRAQVIFHHNTKNGRFRQVPLTESALCAIAAMPKVGNTVFYHPDLLRPWTSDGVSIPWERARKAAGHTWLRVHDLRHAYGIRLAEQGCPMHFISEVLGHASVDFTRRIYARFSPDSASKTVLRVLQGRKASTGGETR